MERPVFRGRFEHTIDGKGRLSVPSRFREVLAERYDGRLVITASDGCLSLYPFAEWRQIEEKVAGLPEFNRDKKNLLRFFYSNATDCTIDKLGRILVPQSMREYASLEKQVLLLGALKRIEIWSKARWDAAEAAVSADEMAGALERLGL